MYAYDPEHAPLPWEWLALDEQERILLAEEFHRRTGIKLPNLEAHAAFHAIVENQLAENLASAVRAMARLTAEGLSRHEAVHAIGFVLAGHLNNLFKGKVGSGDPASLYDAALDKLSARGWRKGGEGV